MSTLPIDLPSLHSTLLSMFPGCSVVLHFSQAFPSIGSAGIEVAIHPNTKDGQDVVRDWFQDRTAPLSDVYGDGPRNQRHWEFNENGVRFIGFWKERLVVALSA